MCVWLRITREDVRGYPGILGYPNISGFILWISLKRFPKFLFFNEGYPNIKFLASSRFRYTLHGLKSEIFIIVIFLFLLFLAYNVGMYIKERDLQKAEKYPELDDHDERQEVNWIQTFIVATRNSLSLLFVAGAI